MKFVHIAGDYAVKDGVTFLFKNPTTVDNKSTIEKLLKDPAFKPYQDPNVDYFSVDAASFLENPFLTDKGRAAIADAIKDTKASPDACPKCGRIVKRGKFMHVKHCKGKA